MAETSEKCDWRSDLLALMVLDPIGAFLVVEETMRRAGEDLGSAERELAAVTERLKTVAGQLVYADKAAETYERQRDKLLAVIEGRVGIIEPITDCDCLDCEALRAAREIVK